MIEIGTEVPVLTAEHADGTMWADIENDIWQPTVYGWLVTRRGPFSIDSQIAVPFELYGPYRAVLGPPPPRDRDDE